MSTGSDGSRGRSSRRRGSRSRRARRKRVWVWSIVAVVAVILLITGWIGIRGFLAYGEVLSARGAVGEVMNELQADPAAAVATLETAGEHTAWAASLVSDPLWRAAEIVPWIGPNLEAFRVTAQSLDTVVRGVALPLAVPAAGFEETLSPVDGRIDPAPLQHLAPIAAEAALRLSDVEAAMERIHDDALVAPLAEAVEEFRGQLGPVAAAVHAVSGATQLVPALLGADGTRETLLLFLNNAELRSTSGIPGALALITAEDGRFALTQQASTRDFPQFAEPVLDLPADIRGLYGERPALFMQNITLVPEFPLTGELAVTMWERQFGTRPQAVIALDPFTLAGVLEATGPITLATGEELTTENAVQFLLHDVYIAYPNPAVQDVIFADAASRVFSAVASGGFDPVRLIGALVTATDANQVRVWSSIDAEQAVLAGTRLEGRLPEGSAGEAPFTLLLNDGTGSKMDVYLSSQVELVSGGCPIDAADPTVTLRLTLTNTATPEEVAGLPDYITGGGWFLDAPAGEMLTIAQVFAPPGAELWGLRVNGESGGASSELALGRSLSTWSVQLAPGESQVLELDYRLDAYPGADVTWLGPQMFMTSEHTSGGHLCKFSDRV